MDSSSMFGIPCPDRILTAAFFTQFFTFKSQMFPQLPGSLFCTADMMLLRAFPQTELHRKFLSLTAPFLCF